MSPTLTDLMHRATDGHDPDLTTLAHEARRRGLGIRRRRQALGLVGATAAVTLVLGGAQVVGDAARDAGAPAADRAASARPELVRSTGQTTAAALLAVLQDVSAGRASDVQGGGTGADPGSTGAGTVASLTWTPASGSGPTRVEVHVRPATTDSQECRFRVGSSCELVVERDGTEVQRLDLVAPRDARGHMVVVRRPDGTEVAVSSLVESTSTASRLTLAQLEEVAASPAFGPRMDATWADPDRLPADFEDLGARMDGTGAFGPGAGFVSLEELRRLERASGPTDRSGGPTSLHELRPFDPSAEPDAQD